MTPSSQEMYVKEGGIYCPVCATDEIADDCPMPEIIGNTVEVERYCHNCDAEWRDVFTLTGYTQLTSTEIDED